METPETFNLSPESLELLKKMFYPLIRNAIRAELQKHFIEVRDEHSRRVWIDVAAIAWITVEHEIVVFHAPGLKEKTLHRCGSLQMIEEEIDDPAYFRANKNTLVNRNHVVDANTGHREILMDDGMTVHYTETFYAVVRQAIPDFFKKMTA